ncbi:MAG TPA: hypothetical protein VFY36_00130 [Solirubrobacteraceae bacterium]|nr:hypothetical protein [Solirubrobacteraceae bacterium]
MRFARPERRLAPPAALLAVMVIVATAASPASANVGETIIERCTHGESLRGFSHSAYTQALKELSADTEEYSDCSSLIRQAQRAAASGAGNDGAGAGVAGSVARPTAVAVSPSEQRAITHAARGRAQPVKLGGASVAPGVVHTNISSALSSLPTPLLATLAFLLACALVLLGDVLRKRIRVRRSG